MREKVSKLGRDFAALPAGSCLTLTLLVLAAMATNPAFAAELRLTGETSSVLKMARRALCATQIVEGEHRSAPTSSVGDQELVLASLLAADYTLDPPESTDNAEQQQCIPGGPVARAQSPRAP